MKSEKGFGRRNFLKVAVAGGAAMLAPKLGAASKQESVQLIKPPKKLIYRMLGNTGIKVPVVSMGVMRSDNPGLVKAALEAGILHLDTAHGYQGGKNEEMLGNLLKDYPRDSFVIATKIHPKLNKDTGLFEEDDLKKTFFEMLEISLKRLQMQYVDILYIHAQWNPEAVLNPLLLDILKEAVATGKTRFIGVSTHRNEAAVIRAAITSKVYNVVLTSYNFMQEGYVDVRNAIAEASAAGLGVIAMKTMAGGWLDKEKTKPVNAKAALKWALQDENVHTSIPGFSTFEQLQEDLDVMNEALKMSKKEKESLIIPKSEETGSLFCPACDDCQKSCAKRLPVPEIMRAYMYTYGYRDLALAQETLQRIELHGNPCSDCDECTIDCRKGFDVKARISDVSRVSDIPKEFIS